jgi:uncharacterized protein (UPF0147 family)
MEQKLTNAIELMYEIEEDFSVPKNIRLKIKEIINYFQDDSALIEIKASKAIDVLDNISDDINVPSHTRAQIWSIMSLLESNE